MPWPFLVAYTCSGVAGLIYEVSWTRLLTLQLGHTTGAASAVVAAFLGGLAVGAAGGGAVASSMTPRASLRAYVAIEAAVALAALALPFELRALTPVLSWAYGDGATGPLFRLIRLLFCFALVFLPATALGATFPLAIRGFASASNHIARSSGALYALNTAGAAIGALLAGFALIPSIGVSGTTTVGMAASAVAALVVAMELRRGVERVESPVRGAPGRREKGVSRSRRSQRGSDDDRTTVGSGAPWLAAAVLGLSGFAALLHEIVWTRIVALVIGPTIYAFSATLAAVILGLAVGSAAGTMVIARTRHAAAWLSSVLALAAIAVSYTSHLAGGDLVRLVATTVSGAEGSSDNWLARGLMVTFALVLPTAMCLGAAFPMALATAGSARLGDGTMRSDSGDAAARFGVVYAVNTIGAVAGSLSAGYVFIPLLGLQSTLRLVTSLLIVAALIVLAARVKALAASAVAGMAAAIAAGVMLLSPPWDRDLLASGGYLYAPYVPAGLDREALLRAGTLLYYREGASATVSVKRLTGTLTLAVDGKTDASNRGDMLTQKLIAHLPLLLHDDPREVAIVGLGSGVTVGSALRHPVTRVDVIELSREVVEASRHFATENQRALDDPRTRLIVGDGRSHLHLASRRYDAIVSEPSNPWIAGVAALFTREFFESARDHLAPGGVIGQWANAYNISDADLRAIVATFRSVFPDATVWLVGGDDVLMVGSRPGGAPIETRLAGISANWNRPGVSADLAERSVHEPFSVLSMYAAGPRELDAYVKDAAILVDDRMTLEFSAPRELRRRGTGANSAALAALLGEGEGPPAVREAMAAAGAPQWRSRGAMMAKRDAHEAAFDDFVHALRLGPDDVPAMDGLVRTAILTRRGADALSWLKTLRAERPATVDSLVAGSKLLASTGARAEAAAAAREAAGLAPSRFEPFEQMASLFADSGDTAELDVAVAGLERTAPERAVTSYFAAVSALLKGRVEEALPLARRAIERDRTYAPVSDLIGAIHTKLGQPVEAREAFLTSLQFDPHDSTAYTNLGLLELTAGNHEAAANYFAEALWLDPDSTTARQGLQGSRAGRMR